VSAPLWTSAEADAATGARSTRAWAATGVSIDSRTIAPGELFVALAGENHDGHDHLAAAFAAGAAAALVARVPAGLRPDAPLLLVDDTLAGLRRLGLAARARAGATRIAAITGSVGKTGTKEALARVLGAQARTHAAAASFNNHIGVPLTLARLPRDAAYAAFEIGMNHEGEIDVLVRMVRPHVALVTTVEAAHAGYFLDGVEGVARAKSEIFVAGGETAVLNRDNRFFGFLSERARAAGFARVLGFGADRDAEFRVVDAANEADGSSVTARADGRTLRYRVGAPGRHWVMNSLAVLAAAHALGADLDAAAAALADFAPPKGRGRRHVVAREGGHFVLIDDSYNASPPSMRACFEVLAAIAPGPGGRRVAVLGDMLELGPDAPTLHAGLAPDLVGRGIDLVLTCGPNMARLHEALPAAMRGGHAADSARLLPLVRALVRPGDVVAVKGSLGSRMGPIVEALLANGGANGAPRRAAG
jgi:UDP-N-acetylmuramoyl-tripeptide--D-alanyl-D-alanine ligase